MAAAGIEGIEVERPREVSAAVEKDRRDFKEAAKETYARAVAAASAVTSNAKLGKAVGFSKAKRLVHSLVELLLQDEPIVLGLTALRCHEEYTHNHSVNVCILGLVMASRLGYPKPQLGEMGVAFLFHDIGKLHIPLAILNKPDRLTEEEWKVMRTHPIEGVKAVIKLKGVGDPAIGKLVTAAFEHHLGYVGGGYPKLATPWHQSLIGRITAITDCYDAMTSARVYIRTPYSPERALQYMLEGAGTAFDPALLKVFVNSIGIYPIGTLVLLDTEELGVVVQANPNPNLLDRPKVQVVTNRAGDEIDGQVVDLAAIDAGTNGFKRSIVKAIDSTKYSIDTARYLI
jgi:HD-GYP domain-containing protein (c-di-GMP phosphodiesterase class II)